MSARKSKVVKVNISAGTYKDEAEAVKEANAIKRWLIRYCDKNGYSVKGKVWISTNSAYAGRIINKGRKKEYKPNGKPLPTVVEAHIHMVLFCNPASTIVDALKSYLNKKHMKAVVWDRHCNSRAEVENAVEYAMRQSRKVRTIDYDRKDVLSVDEWGYYEAVEKAEARIKDNMAFTKSEPEQTPETLENKSVSSITDTPETLTYKSIKHNYLYYYIASTSYNHSIVKALLQNIIYYSRESSRSSCSKIIFKKVLLKVPHLLKKMSFCVIMIMIDEESVVLVTEISNSYILLVKQNEKESSVKITESSDNKPHTIVLSTKKYEPFREYLSSCFAEIKEIYDLSSLPTYYECRFKHYKSPNVKMFVYCVRGDCYADITVSGKNKDRIIQQMELIHTTLEKSKASEQFTLITSYDSVSEYYCNKMYPLLNEVERKLRKLLSKETKDLRYYYIAENQADHTIETHIRADGSVRHIVDLDAETGEIKEVLAGQGFSPDSAWSRGQGWAIYGYALSYIHTGKQIYLDTAKKVANFFIANIVDSGFIPRVDLKAPGKEHDTSAGAVAACGLIEIANCVDENERDMYLNAAIKLLRAMEEKYCIWDEKEESVLTGCVERYFPDEGRKGHNIVYGDYYFVEAIYKLKGFEPLFW